MPKPPTSSRRRSPAQTRSRSNRSGNSARATSKAAGEQNAMLAGAVRVGAIDIGSNAVRFIVAQAQPDGTFRHIHEDRDNCRLGRGMAGGKGLARDAIERAAAAIERFAAKARELNIVAIRAVATAAVRESKNADAFLSLVKQRAGLVIDIIHADEEARLGFRGAAASIDLYEGLVAVLDIGGGSAQLTIAKDGVLVASESGPLGAVRLTEHFGGPAAFAGKNFDAAVEHVRRHVKTLVPREHKSVRMLAATGGTVTSLAAMAAGQILKDFHPGEPLVALPREGEVHRRHVDDLIALLRATPLEKRAELPGLPAERADIILAGLVVLREVMRRLKITGVEVCGGGVRVGLAAELAERVLLTRHEGPQTAISSAERLLIECRAEREHAEQGARLTLRLFDMLADVGPLAKAISTEPRARELLHAAALAHDVGCFVDYAKHHKHSERIIRLAGMAGLTDRELRLVSLIARYHRRAEPPEEAAIAGVDRDDEHVTFANLAPKDRALVCALAALLRVGDGLDRSHTQRVTDIHGVTIEPKTLAIHVAGPSAIAKDLKAAKKKSALLARLLGKRVAFDRVKVAKPSKPRGSAARDIGSDHVVKARPSKRKP
ncbi:MAG: Ppx/GppA phosphatase family protein [Planctomycetota bacterium]|nr:Ppx/GppA phosphatase family protein [Planctomycetota bacterium]